MKAIKSASGRVYLAFGVLGESLTDNRDGKKIITLIVSKWKPHVTVAS